MKLLYKKGQKVRYFCLSYKWRVRRIGTIVKVCREYESVPAHYHIDTAKNFVLPEEIIGAA